MNTRTTAATLAVALAALLVPCALSGADDPPAPAPPTAPNAEEAKKTWEWMLEESLYGEFYRRGFSFDQCGALVNHWVALVDYDLAYKVCNSEFPDASSQDGETNAAIEKTWEFDVREKPDASSSRLGKIVVRMSLTPDENVPSGPYVPWIRAIYVPEGDEQPVDFEPDLVQLDFGYTGLFHQTYIERSGIWFKLPKNPLPKPGWIDFSLYKPFPHVLHVTHGGLYRLGEDTYVIPIDAHPAGLTCRKVLPNEDPCCGDDCPVLPENVIMIPYSELYDADGHFRLHPACPKGC